MTNKVAVLFGGTSAEREVSLKSGYAVLKGLQAKGIDAHGIDTKENSINELKKEGFGKVFIALHGRGGEDGIIQSILTYQNIPYTGSDVLSSALSMNKLKTKQIWQSYDLPIANYVFVEENQFVDSKNIIEQLGLPLFVKPIREGSSVGMSRVDHESDLFSALNFAFQFDKTVMIESFLSGPEYTIAIVGDDVLPVVRIESVEKFYDYNAKYLSDKTQYFCPSGLSDEKEKEIQDLALKAYHALGCRGWGRVDIMFNSNNEAFLLEVNTSPGMTDHSLVPIAAKQKGWTFDDLVCKILDLAQV